MGNVDSDAAALRQNGKKTEIMDKQRMPGNATCSWLDTAKEMFVNLKIVSLDVTNQKAGQYKEW